jgi:pyruvate/2-oxoglutarate dehydrogenase complex dihydrolipoamide dehydrogenase (E3) component
LFFGRAKASALTIPWCTYTSPEVAHVGLTAHEAAARGVPIQTLRQELAHIDRAILAGETEGFVEVHLRGGTDKIVGATLVAEHAGEMIGELVLAMNAGLGLRKIGATIHPYPTVAEAIRKLGDQYNRTRLTPFVKRLFHAWLKWTR